MVRSWSRGLAEGVLLLIVCLSPWAFGGADAWAKQWLFAAVGLAAALSALGRWDQDRLAAMLRGPAPWVAGLALLAWAQSLPLGERALRAIAPETARLRAELLPEVPESVVGDDRPAVPLAAPTLSLDPDATRGQVARLAACWALLQAGALVASRPGWSRRLSWALLANGAALTVVMFLQVLTWDGKLLWVRPTEHAGHGGPFVNHNHLAAYLNLGLGFALAGLAVPRKAGPRAGGLGSSMWLAYTGGLLCVGVLGSLSRSGLVGTLVATMACLAGLGPAALRSRRWLGLALALGLIAAAAGLWLSLVGTKDISARLGTFAERSPYQSRFESWDGAFRAWRSHPAWGLGLGAYAMSAFRFYAVARNVYYHTPENEYLRFLAEGGVPGAVLFLGAVGSVLAAGARAVRRHRDEDELRMALGGTFGMIGLATQSLGDYAIETPAIALAGTVVAATLVHAGCLRPVAPGTAGWRRRAQGPAAALLAAVGLAVAHHGWTTGRSAAEVDGTVVPQPGKRMPTATLWDAPAEELDRAAEALDRALAIRPDWGEGHLWMGVVLLSRYRATTLGLLKAEGVGPEEALTLAHPLWLHRLVHALPPEGIAEYGDLTGQSPVRDDLIPAARSFLEARRCCPAAALSHAELAGLDYLLQPGDQGTRYAARALAIAGPDPDLLGQLAETCLQAGDFDLAARCLRRLLEAHDPSWELVADACRAFPPGEVLAKVVGRGRHALWFARRLYSRPEDAEARDMFLRAAVERLPLDRDLDEAERLHWEGLARAGLDDRQGARRCLEAALALRPGEGRWRGELVDQLVAWGQLEEAHDQALIGLQLSSDPEEARKALDRAAEALARGRPDGDDAASPAPGGETDR
jgi:O-antigen ligase/tetratricopeptide (TPR) repeat protein